MNTERPPDASSRTLPPQIPAAPAGYRPPYEFRYPAGTLFVLPVPLAVGASALFGTLAWIVQGPNLVAAIRETSVPAPAPVPEELLALAIPFAIALFVTVVIHELLHGFTLRLYGYDVEYGIEPGLGAVYTMALEQFQSREQLLVVTLAPLTVVTLVCLPLLAATPLVAVTALFVLVLNTGGAAGDAYLAWRCLKLPPGTLLYDANSEHSYIYEPLSTVTSGDGPIPPETAN